MINIAYKIIFFILLVFIISIAGCSTIKLPETTVQPVSQYRLSQAKDNLFIAVEPFYDKEKMEEYFGIDLLSNNILPVLIVAENHNHASSFVLLKDQFSLSNLNSEKKVGIVTSSEPAVSTEKAASVGGGVALTGAALLSPPLILLGGKIAGDALVIKHNLTTKELMTKTLSPDKSQYGFVYFKFNDKNDITANCIAEVKAINLQSDNVLTFTFPLCQEVNE